MGFTQEQFDAMTKSPDFKAKVVVHPEARLPEQGYKKEKRSPTLPKLPVASPAGVSHIKGILQVLGVKYETEYMFDAKRLFRFDICVPAMMLGIEYEGIFNDGGKNGHTGLKHYIKDCEKYNLATVQGWRLLRYTGNNYKDFITDFNKLIEHDTSTAND